MSDPTTFAALHRTLSFYAAPACWKRRTNPDNAKRHLNGAAHDDRGAQAREALPLLNKALADHAEALQLLRYFVRLDETEAEHDHNEHRDVIEKARALAFPTSQTEDATTDETPNPHAG